MSKISELGPIKGANTRSEDLFVIVNLIQGDDGTKNITRKELVQAIQYEIFDRITITGGSITNVTITRSQIDNNTMENNTFSDGDIEDTDIVDGTMVGTELSAVTIANSEITDSDFSDGTGNNNVFTNTIVDNGQLNNSTGNNDTFTNSTIDDSLFNNVTIEQGTANGLILTNITIDELILEDATISNSTITTTDFSNGDIFDVEFSNSTIVDTDISNSDIRDTDLDNVDIINSRFSNGYIWDTEISNSDIFDTNANNIVITNSEFDDGTANNVQITNSDFSDGTGNNNTFTNATLEDATFTGDMSDVVATNIDISSSTSDGLVQKRSTISNSDLEEVNISNSVIEESELADFDMNLTKTFEAPIDEDSYFALKNVKTGDTEQMTYRQLYDEFSRKTDKALKVHVASDGDDANPGTILQPVRTLKRAEEIALEKAGGSYDRNDINNAVHISVGPGTYYVDEPIMLPDDTSMTSTAGQYATVIQKKKGWERTNGVLVGSGCYVQGFSYMNFEVDNFDQPEGGFAIAYRPGALLRRSPYLRDSSQLSNFNRLDVEPPLNPFNSKGTILDLGQEFYLKTGHSPQAQFEIDDEVTFSSGATGYISYIADIDSDRQIYVRNLKGNVEVGDMLYAQRGGTGEIEKIGIDDFPNRLVGRGGGCLLADRAVLDTDSLYTYVLCFGFTPRTQNGTGYVAKNGAGVNGIGSLSIFTRQAFFALDGGQMTLNNSGSQFGDISMRARGSTVIIKPAEANDTNIVANTDFADVLEDKADEIIDDMIDYLTANTSTGFGGNPGLGYQGYNADKCFRDTGIIVDNTGYDIATNSNYWGRLNGITYRSPISYVVVNEQLDETVGSIEHLKESMDHIFANANTDVTDRLAVSINETLNVLQNGEEHANNIIFADTGNGSAVAARELVQDNREFIIEEFIDWLDNNEEFYAYDSAKCKRDVREFILPAVKYDTMLDTNYNSVTAGNAYYFKAAKNVIGAQREETVAAYERLRKTTDDLVQANSAIFAAEAYDKFTEIVDILKFEGDKFTPTAVAYTPTTGEFVMTIEDHGLEVGRYILLSPESFTFTCDTDGNKLELKHPRKSDPAFKSLLPIRAVTTNTITLNVGSTGYKGVHTLKEVADDAVIVIGSEITFSDDSSIPADRRNARKQLQTNKEFIQNYMMDWADDEWFFYDSKKCQRDMKDYIVPAVLRDMQTGTNFNSIQSGIAYRSGIAKVAVTDQLTETIGAIDHLKQETANTVTDPVVIQRIDDGFDEIIAIARNNSKKYTPTAATYDVDSGVMVVTIGAHDFQIGDTIIIEKESMTFECGSPAQQISHPRTTDPAYNTALPITAKTATTITVNVGDAGGYTGAHTFVSANANAIREASVYDGKFTPTAVDYNPVSGDMTLTIGQHALTTGKWISMADMSITFSCDTANGETIEISHPRPGDPAFRQSVRIMDTTATTIKVNVANANGYTGDHTFISADVDCIDSNAIYWTDPAKIDSFYTPSTATYNPSTGDMVLTLGSGHGITTDDHIEFKPGSVTFSCANGASIEEISHPRIGEPNYMMPLEVTAADATTITVNPGTANGYANTHTFVSAEEGAVIKLPENVTRQGKLAADALLTNRKFLQGHVDNWLKTNYFVYDERRCARDTGYILDAVRRDFATGSNINSVFAGFAYRSGNASANLVITDQLTETTGAINWLRDQIASRISDATAISRSNAAFNEMVDIITNGTGNADPITFGSSYVSGSALRARQALQANKEFLKDEVTAWIAANHPDLTYDVADCERDLGYFIDAISWDVQHGSNAVTIGNARLYFDNAVGVLAEDEKPVTAAAYKHIGELAGQIVREEEIQSPDQSVTSQTFNSASNALTPTGATYNPTTGVMVVTVASHTLEVGDYVVIEEGGITFECGTPAQQISHPRATDPYFNTPIRIDATTSTTLTMQVGNAGTYTEAHTFVSALTNAIRPSADPAVANEVVRLFNTISDIVEEDNYKETFGTEGYYDTKGYVSGGAGYGTDGKDTGLTNPTIKEPTLTGTGYDAAINADFENVLGATAKYQKEIIDFIREEYNGLAYNTDLCYRDIGMIVDAVAEDMEYGGDAATANAAQYYFKNAVSILPYDQREPTRLAYAQLADAAGDVVTGTMMSRTFGNSFTPTDAEYDPTSGHFTITIGSHSLDVGDYIWLEEEGITLECGSPAQQISHPRTTDPAYQVPQRIIAKTATSISVNVGKAGTYTGLHTFVSADANAVKHVTGNTEKQTLPATGFAANATTETRLEGLIDLVADTVDNRLVIPDYAGSLDITQQTPKALPTANTDISPLIEPSRTFARKSLQMNKEFIQDEVVAFINDKYFTYDENKCARDVGYILDAVKRDVQTGSDYPSKYAGRAYRAGNAGTDKVINEQLAETIEAIKYMRNDVEPRLTGVAKTRATAAFDNIIEIMKEGTSGLTYTSWGTANVGNSDNAATDGLQLNRAFLAAEGKAHFQQTYATLWNSLTAAQRDKCERDIGYMVDAVSFDIRHGSNVAMRDVARLYFENGTSVLPADQKTETAGVFAHVAAIAERVVLKQTVTPTPGNAASQVLSGFGNVVAGTGADVENLFLIVRDLILEDSLINMPAAQEPNAADPAAQGYDYETDVATIEGRKSTLSTGVNKFLQDTFDYLEYNSAKCRRDVGYMVDAISHDIQYGGNSAMWNAAQIYFVNMTNLLPLDQRDATREAFTRMAHVMHDVIRNETVPMRIGRTYTPSTATYNPLDGEFVVTLPGGHSLKAGDYVTFPTDAFTFSCVTADSEVVELKSPRATDPFGNAPIKVESVTSTTITVHVGAANGYIQPHTFVSAEPHAVQTVLGHTRKQDMSSLTARREIAAEAKELAMMVANIADDNNPDNLPARVEPFTNWMPAVVKTEKDKVDNALETLVTSMINFISSEYNGISYPKEKCRRDVGIIIDALSHDVQYWTNYATRLCANMYFDNATSVLPFDQRTQTADFYVEMAEVVANVVRELQSGQDTSGTPATATEAEWAADMVRIIEEMIRRDGLDALPEIVEPDTSWVEASKLWAGDVIDENLNELADDVTDYIKDNFTIVDYSKAKCRRDSGYILDAMSWDLNYGGNLASRWNADFYYWNNELRIPENTREATAKSYRQLGKIVSDVVLGKYPGQTMRPEVGAEEQSQQAYDLGMIFYNALFYNTPKALGPTKKPDFAWEEDKQFKFAKDILGNNRTFLQREVQRFITSEYKFIDLPKTYRDAGNLIKLLANDFRFIDPALNVEGSDKATRSFVGALFNIDAQHVFPVFNPPAAITDWRKLRFKGTRQTNAGLPDGSSDDPRKRWDAYIVPTSWTGNRYEGRIWYFNGTTWIDSGQDNNTDLLDSFTGAWTQMKTYINNNIAVNQDQRDMVTELIDNVLIDSVVRPNFLTFGSLVESIAHQFNGASAGVNRNALPLNFRNVGAAIGANASVLSENGGRIRWSGSDELNNQYFARGLRINGRTGRIEGRPFTSSVRKLARRASNSRAAL